MERKTTTLFTDTKSRKWDLELSVRAAADVRKATGADVLNHPLKAIEQFGADQIQFFDAAWAIVRPQAVAANVTEDEFKDAIAGDVIEQALDAFFEALISFSPSPSGRAALRQVQQTLKKIGERVKATAKEKLDKSLAGLDLHKEVERFVTSGAFATRSAESSGSTRPASPSVS